MPTTYIQGLNENLIRIAKALEIKNEIEAKKNSISIEDIRKEINHK